MAHVVAQERSAYFDSFSAPPPLRDANHALGLPGLRPHDKVKVDQANILYEFCIQLLDLCRQLSMTISVENPERAVFAHYARSQSKDFQQWFASLDRINFDSCMRGGSRQKKTRLLASPGVYTTLALRCDSMHQPWGIHQEGQHLRFDTATEAQHPPKDGQLSCMQ